MRLTRVVPAPALDPARPPSDLAGVISRRTFITSLAGGLLGRPVPTTTSRPGLPGRRNHRVCVSTVRREERALSQSRSRAGPTESGRHRELWNAGHARRERGDEADPYRHVRYRRSRENWTRGEPRTSRREHHWKYHSRPGDQRQTLADCSEKRSPNLLGSRSCGIQRMRPMCWPFRTPRREPALWA